LRPSSSEVTQPAPHRADCHQPGVSIIDPAHSRGLYKVTQWDSVSPSESCPCKESSGSSLCRASSALHPLRSPNERTQSRLS
ncbi:hypothetical protein NDU88_005221, partial [Pleurodeles waltl]